MVKVETSPRKQRVMRGPWLVYIIQSTTSTRTYVGCTNNFARRIRQHNGDLAGGAKYTAGNLWAPVVLVEGFSDDQRHALQFEWALKHRKRRGTGNGSGVERRIRSLHQLLGQERVTSKAPPLIDVDICLTWHSAEACDFFKSLITASPLPMAPTEIMASRGDSTMENAQDAKLLLDAEDNINDDAIPVL